MKNIILLTAIILFTINCFGENNNKKHKRSKKLSYSYYINQYAKDDTSTAIINLYYRKSEIGSDKMSITPVAAALAFVVPPVGVGLTIISTPLLASGVITKIKYNKKRMKKALQDYNQNKHLSENLKKNVCKQINIERDNFNELLAEN